MGQLRQWEVWRFWWSHGPIDGKARHVVIVSNPKIIAAGGEIHVAKFSSKFRPSACYIDYQITDPIYDKLGLTEPCRLHLDQFQIAPQMSDRFHERMGAYPTLNAAMVALKLRPYLATIENPPAGVP